MSKQRVLIIEDDPDGLRSVADAVEDAGFDVVTAVTGAEGLRAFQTGPFDLVLTDLVLPDLDGIAVLTRLRGFDTRVPVLIMTAYGSVSSSVAALKAGAYDYLTKPLDLDELQTKLRRAAEAGSLRQEVTTLRQAVRQTRGLAALVAESAGMRRVVEQIEALAGTHATVLIEGESGTGKEVVARALHAEGPRAQAPFVAVNCGAFAESLLESELFGHEKGAFTGATAQHKGAFERAHGGTLFLDEIGDAPPAVQIRLLRVLEDREVTRIGGREPFRVDVRVISATHQDLDERVEAGAFRKDLLYRLKVVTIAVPPLRERLADIRPLADRFIQSTCREHGRSLSRIAPDVYTRLEAFDWPGNVRQLRNVIESSVIMARRGELTGADLALAAPAAATAQAETGAFVCPAGLTLAEIEREVLVQSLRRNEGNRSLTADKLGISRRTIQRKIKEYDLPY